MLVGSLFSVQQNRLSFVEKGLHMSIRKVYSFRKLVENAEWVQISGNYMHRLKKLGCATFSRKLRSTKSSLVISVHVSFQNKMLHTFPKNGGFIFCTLIDLSVHLTQWYIRRDVAKDSEGDSTTVKKKAQSKTVNTMLHCLPIAMFLRTTNRMSTPFCFMYSFRVFMSRSYFNVGRDQLICCHKKECYIDRSGERDEKYEAIRAVSCYQWKGDRGIWYTRKTVPTLLWQRPRLKCSSMMSVIQRKCLVSWLKLQIFFC